MLFTSDNAAYPLKHATNNNGVRIKTDFCQGQSRYQLPPFDHYDFERHGTADKNCPVHWYSFIDIQTYFDFERHSNYDFERQVGSHRRQRRNADKHCTADRSESIVLLVQPHQYCKSEGIARQTGVLANSGVLAENDENYKNHNLFEW